MGKTFRVVFGGTIAALCIVLMLCTGLFPFATVALPAIAGVLLIPVVIELGVKWAALVYAVVSIVAFFITPEPSAMLMFVFFFGCYPILKALIEKIRKSMLEWALKFLLVNVSFFILFFLAQWLFNLNDVLPNLQVFGRFTFLVVWLGVNVVFLIYDLALTRLVCGYMNWFKPKYMDKINRRGR